MSLLILSFFILKNLFYENLFTIRYSFNNNIEFILLAYIYATRYSFINEEFIEEVYHIFDIIPQYPIKLKQI